MAGDETRRRTRRQSANDRFEDLIGKVPSQAAANRSMASLGKSLQAEFQEAGRDRKAASRTSAAIREPLVKAIGEQGARAAAKGVQSRDRTAARGVARAPEVISEDSRILVGSIGAVVSTPLHYQWSWNATSGSPGTVQVAANRSDGTMAFHLATLGNDASASGRAAVGIYFRPITANGILRVRANPSYNYSWGTYCSLADGHSDGFIGLYVGRYTLSGGPDGAPVNQQIRLWSNSSWWSGSSGSGSSTGYPLFAEFGVDSAHFYQIWVWCGGYVSGDGSGTFYYGSGRAVISARVPSISWELF